MATRGRRGNGAAALFAARMTDEIEVDEDENHGLPQSEDIENPAEEPEEDGYEVEEPEPGEVTPDYSHEEPEEDDEEEPEEAPDALAAMKAQLAQMQAERDAEKASKAVDDEATELRRHQGAIATGLRQSQNALNAAKASLAKAGEAGNWAQVAEAQAEIAAATADLREFEAAADEVRSAVDAFNAGVRRKPAEPARQPAAQTDVFETAIAPMSKKSQDWCRANKADLTKSLARSKKAESASLEANELGYAIDTPEYFAHLNKTMGYKPAMTKTPKPTGKARIAAPAGGGGAPSRSSENVKLSRSEVETAQAVFAVDPSTGKRLTSAESVKMYAAHKKEIIANGKDPSRGGPTYTAHQARR